MTKIKVQKSYESKKQIIYGKKRIWITFCFNNRNSYTVKMKVLFIKRNILLLCVRVSITVFDSLVHWKCMANLSFYCPRSGGREDKEFYFYSSSWPPTKKTKIATSWPWDTEYLRIKQKSNFAISLATSY